MASMPAGFESLSNNGIGTVGLQPECFIHRGGGGEDDRAPTSHMFEQFEKGKAKMEAHHWRFKFTQNVGHIMAERGPTRPRRNARGINHELFVIRGAQIPPSRL